MSGKTSRCSVRYVADDQCSDDVERHDRSVLIACTDDLMTSLTRDWADQRQLVDVMSAMIPSAW